MLYEFKLGHKSMETTKNIVKKIKVKLITVP